MRHVPVPARATNGLCLPSLTTPELLIIGPRHYQPRHLNSLRSPRLPAINTSPGAGVALGRRCRTYSNCQVCWHRSEACSGQIEVALSTRAAMHKYTTVNVQVRGHACMHTHWRC